jgi:hypothetical protein
MQNLTPMAAVGALYSAGQRDLSEAIVASLSQAVFSGDEARPASRKKILIGGVSSLITRWTTRTLTESDGEGGVITRHKNVLLEGSGHPYARTLLTSSGIESASLVEGGAPMNGPYMMLCPELRKNGGMWDRIFFDSVQSKDVQFRFLLETRATYRAARQLLESGESVRIKAVAAGTGLSLILVFDKLIRDGFAPGKITADITDRDPANIVQTNRLLEKLASTRSNLRTSGGGHGVSAVAEDVFAGPDSPGMAGVAPYNIVTAIGIFEYFQGHSTGTTEQRMMLDEPIEAKTAYHLAARLGEMTADGGFLIVNTNRDHPCIRILELFGKRFDFRDREHLGEVLASSNFRSSHLEGSGHIYDVEMFEKFRLEP